MLCQEMYVLIGLASSYYWNQCSVSIVNWSPKSKLSVQSSRKTFLATSPVELVTDQAH